jgi:hypothetical protein
MHHCPHLEETSALFDGQAGEHARLHANDCAECAAFLTDAAHLRAYFREGSDPAVWGLTPPPVRPRPGRHLAIPAFALAMMVIAILWLARPRPRVDAGVFAGLDGGGRATIIVKEVAR